MENRRKKTTEERRFFVSLSTFYVKTEVYVIIRKLTFMRYVYVLLVIMFPAISEAQNMPFLKPEATYNTPEGAVLTGSYPDDVALSEIQNAPLGAVFTSNPQNAEGWNVSYEWVIEVDTVTASSGGNFYELARRFEEDLSYDFVLKGMYRISLRATFSDGTDRVQFPAEDNDPVTFTFSISGSKLKFPNTFTPNGDGQNDILKAKEYQSIVEFHAAVFNRWGKRLYEWDDVDDGWDGRYGGDYVRNGAYYLVVNAKGADGTRYRIKKTINVFTNKNRDYDDEP